MSQQYNPPTPPTSRGPLTAVWAVCTAAALGFVVAFTPNAPYQDEWEFVPALTGRESIPPWLWAQHNEHRLPLPRLVFLGLFKLTHDFRAGSVLQVLLMSGLALGMMRLAARGRGRPHWADAFFPLSLLHPGHWENLVMGYQLCFALFAVLTTGLAAVALTAAPETARRDGARAGLLAAALSLCGGFGLIVALPVSVWVAWRAVGVWRRGEPGSAAGLLALAAFPAVYLAFYVQGYHRPDHHPPPGDPLSAAMVAAEVLAVSFGIGVEHVWVPVAAGVVGLGVATAGVLAADLRRAADRPAAAGLLAVLAGVGGLAAAIGVGRSGFVDGHTMGLWSRYAWFSWPALAAAFLVWTKRGNAWVPAALCVAAALALVPNYVVGVSRGVWLREWAGEIEADVRAGRPAADVVRDHMADTGQEERAVRGMPMLRDAGVGWWVFLRDDLPEK